MSKRIRHGIVNQDNVVVNVIIWNGAEWQPPRGHWVVQDDKVNIGDIYDPDTKIINNSKGE